MNILSGAAILAGVAYAQTYSTGLQVVTFFSGVDDTDQPYALYVPRNSNHRLNLRCVFGRGNLPGETGLEAAARNGAKDASDGGC